jgi:hypothetical protein
MAFKSKKNSDNDYLPAKKDDSTYEIMNMNKGEVAQMLRENVGAEKLTANDLTRITVPSQGSTTWLIPTIEGEQSSKTIEGVIILTQSVRAYWKDSFDESGGGTPPDCVSRDGLEGRGTPGGDCLKCELSQWESDKKGRGKACSESRLVYLIQPDEILPIVIKVPATSLASARKYLFGLTSARKPVHSVFTKITLEKASNADRIDYSKIIFEMTGDVPNAEVTKAYADDIRPFLDTSIEQFTSQQDNDPIS